MGSRCRKHSWAPWEGAAEEESGLSWFRNTLPGCWCPPLPGTNQIPAQSFGNAALYLYLLFCFLLAFSFFPFNCVQTNWHKWVLGKLVGALPLPCLSNSRVYVSCLILSSDPSLPCFYWHLALPSAYYVSVTLTMHFGIRGAGGECESHNKTIKRKEHTFTNIISYLDLCVFHIFSIWQI